MGGRGEVNLTELIRNVHEPAYRRLSPGQTPSHAYPRTCARVRARAHTHTRRLIIQILISAAFTCDSDKQVSARNNLAGNKSLW